MLNKILLSISVVFLIFSCFLFTQSVYAKEGDFYEQNKDKFKDAPADYIEQVKKYDSETKSFKCGNLEFECNINNYIFKLGVGTMKFTEKQIDKFVIKPEDILNNERYEKYQEGVSGICRTILIIFIMFQSVKIMSFRMLDASDADIVLNDKIVQIFTTSTILYLYKDILTWGIQFQQFFVEGVAEHLVDGDFIDRIASTAILSGDFVFYAMLFAGILIFILVLQFLYRMALGGVLYIMGPLAIVTKVNDSMNFYDLWIKLWLSTLLTYCLQVICVTLGFNFFLTPPLGYGENENFLLGLAFFILAITIPSLLGQFGMSTGTTRTLVRFIRKR